MCDANGFTRIVTIKVASCSSSSLRTSLTWCSRSSSLAAVDVKKLVLSSCRAGEDIGDQNIADMICLQNLPRSSGFPLRSSEFRRRKNFCSVNTLRLMNTADLRQSMAIKATSGSTSKAQIGGGEVDLKEEKSEVYSNNMTEAMGAGKLTAHLLILWFHTNLRLCLVRRKENRKERKVYNLGGENEDEGEDISLGACLVGGKSGRRERVRGLVERFKDLWLFVGQKRGVLTYKHELGMNYNFIRPDLIVGSCLQTPDDVDKLRGIGVKTIFCLQQDSDLEDFDSHDLRIRLPAVVSKLHKAINRIGGVSYIHCTAGLGRAPAVALAYMLWVQGYKLSEALKLLLSKRSCSPKVDAIKSATADIPLPLNEEVQVRRSSNARITGSQHGCWSNQERARNTAAGRTKSSSSSVSCDGRGRLVGVSPRKALEPRNMEDRVDTCFFRKQELVHNGTNPLGNLEWTIVARSQLLITLLGQGLQPVRSQLEEYPVPGRKTVFLPPLVSKMLHLLCIHQLFLELFQHVVTQMHLFGPPHPSKECPEIGTKQVDAGHKQCRRVYASSKHCRLC
ncbi:hypothetical protein L484_005216 [Morus notabilis]|uniref:Tyrosine specific protein phosphatases domain-containing protein n=1 Tax=Morus notabilis TaxID=981085 RepID=W9R8S6_9ROSA|nr:hypothetical protein L484_005216 [Morus notabilis]